LLQLSQEPLKPQLATWVPSTQWPAVVALQQKPLPQVPLPALLQASVQAPMAALQVGLSSLQDAQTAPVLPQFEFAVPTRQVPLAAAEQQPPLQAWFWLQAVVHRWVVVLQEYCAAQSVAALQPQAPATQMWPLLLAEQFRHRPPAAPHVVAAVPARQVPLAAAEQQPPLQG